MKILAYLLFVVGVATAISGAAKLPDAGARLPDTFPVFLLGAVTAIVGVAIWRMSVRPQAIGRNDEHEAADDASPFRLLSSLIQPAQKLEQQLDTLDLRSTQQRVDILLETYVLPLAEVRQQVIDRLGMAKGAEILVAVAVGERMLNRVWSAAGDGHLVEARASYPEAVRAFEEADRLSQQYQKL